MITVLKSKIHRATVTDCNVEYNGSITIDEQLMKAANLYPYEQVHVSDVTNGNRFITYVIPGDRGQIIINGAAAKLVSRGDTVIIMAYQQRDPDPHYKATLVFVRGDNSLQAVER